MISGRKSEKEDWKKRVHWKDEREERNIKESREEETFRMCGEDDDSLYGETNVGEEEKCMREVAPEEKYPWTEENLEQKMKGLREVEDIEEIKGIKDMDITGGPKSLFAYLKHAASETGNSHMTAYLYCQEYYKKTIGKVYIEGNCRIPLCVLCEGLDHGIPENGNDERAKEHNVVRVREFMEMSERMK
ncbi:hypothetical protein L873DRAFT_1796196 [Choiromyces venosus 120613-1]|uniref:Uncharacterized protein n=1 Tax=Choiromyces venosus 120613-1 TaxID=1336337 RepID=A0A3N4J5Y7_9PEZI|nr:hypothetical protein L873DRAFT_1796196 [Choiromyces venosus 120613-1]